MRNPRKDSIEALPKEQRHAYLQQNILFNWFIDEHSLLEALLSLNLHRIKYGYLVDDDFRRYVFRGISVQGAGFIANILMSHAREDEEKKCEKFKIEYEEKNAWCSKASYIFSALHSTDETSFWKRSPETLLSYVRRINCGCHENGSFARRKE